jgi:hypothetical protein
MSTSTCTSITVSRQLCVNITFQFIKGENINQKSKTKKQDRHAKQYLSRIWSLEKKQETVIDLVQDMKNQNCDLKQAVKDLKDEYGDLIRQVKVSKLPC